MTFSAEDVQAIDYMRDELRALEAKLEATAPGAKGRKDLQREVHYLRGVWRQAETSIGRRAGGTAVGNSPVNLADTQKIMVLVNGYRSFGKRNTGKQVSGDIAAFEERANKQFGPPPKGKK